MGCSMFKRPHHQRIEKILRTLNPDLLVKSECYFGGGTAIVLSLDEYRESVDIDFLCSSNDGYRLLRNLVSSDLGPLLLSPIKHLREVRLERDKFSTFLEVDGKPIKVEFIHEGNTKITGSIDPVLGIPVLSREDMYTQKLLANADRGLDKASMSRDIIDLSVMIDKWGDIPKQAWDKAYAAYGDYLIRGFHNGIKVVQDRLYLAACLHRMSMDADYIDRIPPILDLASTKTPLSLEDQNERNRRLNEIPLLGGGSSSAYGFCHVAREAISAARSIEDINWIEVERKFIMESIGEYGHSPESVVDTLCKQSPAAVLPARQAAIAEIVERLAPELRVFYAQSHGQKYSKPR